MQFIDKFDGHTWYIPSLLNRLYGYNRDVDTELVAYATEQIVSEQSYSYADLLKAYSAGHVRLLKAIAREGCVKEVLAGDFISRHRLRAASSVKCFIEEAARQRTGLSGPLRVYYLRPFYGRVVAAATVLMTRYYERRNNPIFSAEHHRQNLIHRRCGI